MENNTFKDFRDGLNHSAGDILDKKKINEFGSKVKAMGEIAYPGLSFVFAALNDDNKSIGSFFFHSADRKSWRELTAVMIAAYMEKNHSTKEEMLFDLSLMSNSILEMFGFERNTERKLDENDLPLGIPKELRGDIAMLFGRVNEVIKMLPLSMQNELKKALIKAIEG